MNTTTITSTPIKRKHKAMVHIAKAQLQLTDVAYRAVLFDTAGITSAKHMRTLEQFHAIMRAFSARGFRSDKTRQSLPGQPDNEWGCSKKQRAFIQILWKKKARNPSQEALYAFIERVAHVSHPCWLSSPEASHVIIALQKL